MMAPVDGSGSWPAWMQRVENRALIGELHGGAITISSIVPARTTHAAVDHRRPTPEPRQPTRPSAAGRTMLTRRGPGPAARCSSAALVKLLAIALSARRRATASLIDVVGTAGHARAADRPRVFRRPAHRPRPKRQSAVARPPQADPLLHLRRPRAGAAHHHLLPGVRRCSCSAASASTSSTRGSGAAVEQAQFLARSTAHRARAHAAPRPRRARSSSANRRCSPSAIRDASLAIVPVGRTCDAEARPCRGPAAARRVR